MELLIIRDELINPPTHLYSIRDLTLYVSTFMDFDVILESNDKDLYWYYLKQNYCHDFIDDVVYIGEEEGIRLDIERNYNLTIVTDRIVPENFHEIIGKIKGIYSILQSHKN